MKTFPNHLGDEKQVIVVHNDEITGLVNFGNSLGKQEVGLLVCNPCWVGGGEGNRRVLPQEVVEERPEC